MKDLKIGMEIQGEDDKFEPVIYFSRHWAEDGTRRDDASMTTFLSIHTSGRCIKLTGLHYIPIIQNETFKEIMAKQVRIGDVILERGNREAKVEALGTYRAKGAYMPITKSGKILVDGIVASCHAEPTFRPVVDNLVRILGFFYDWLPLQVYIPFATGIDYTVAIIDMSKQLPSSFRAMLMYVHS